MFSVEKVIGYCTIDIKKIDLVIFGYRINSEKATNCRRWATQILKDYAVRGYLIDNTRLQNGAYLGIDSMGFQQRTVMQYLKLVPLFPDQFAVMPSEYDPLHFLQRELPRIVYIPMQKLIPMKYGNHSDLH
ncbi:MAG: virulence RhuM family protein [Spirochaetales bacterium]|nr:virulence RhuM family protein [Spirochaetales bacterium]